VDVPLDEPRYDARFSAPDAQHGCTVDKFHEFQAVLKDSSRPVSERRVALWFVVHLVGDLHMSLHVRDNHDRAGNDTQVRWLDRGSNMHKDWDAGIIERAGTSEEFRLDNLAELDTAEHRAACMTGTVEEWATESRLAAREAYLIPGTDRRLNSGQKLGDDCQAKHLPVVRRRLYQAGMPLPVILNEAFQEN
jgi:hypothetical protein